MDPNKLPNGWLSSDEAMVVVAERLDHHPNIYWEFCHVKVICKSHDVNKITRRDFALAESINGIL
jgi:pterin-4a-carbinolamine dehydratase